MRMTNLLCGMDFKSIDLGIFKIKKKKGTEYMMYLFLFKVKRYSGIPKQNWDSVLCEGWKLELKYNLYL